MLNPRFVLKVLTLPLSLGSQVYSGIWSHAEIAVGIVAACLLTFAVFFQRTKTTSSTRSFGLQFFGTTWNKIFSYGDKSSPTTADISLSDSPLKQDYQALSEGANASVSGESGSRGSFVKLRRSDLERGEGLQEQEISAPAQITVKHELRQFSKGTQQKHCHGSETEPLKESLGINWDSRKEG